MPPELTDFLIIYNFSAEIAIVKPRCYNNLDFCSGGDRVRFAAAAVSLAIVFISALSLFRRNNKKTPWGSLTLDDGAVLPLCYSENLVGGARSCDAVLQTSRRRCAEAVIRKDSKGNAAVHAFGSKSELSVNGERVRKACELKDGDTVEAGGVIAVFHGIAAPEPERKGSGWLLFSLLLCLYASLFIEFLPDPTWAALAGFGGLAALTLVSFVLNRAMGMSSFAVEALAFTLSGIGMTVVLSSEPAFVYRELLCLAAGIALYCILTLFLKSEKGVRALRIPISTVGLLLLIFSLLTAETILGAKNWIRIGGISFQPSELVKIAFVFAGAAPLYRLHGRKSLVVFIGFSAACVGVLALMGDFGTATVFFIAYIVMAFMRSGSFSAVLLSVSGAGLAAFIAVSAKPYIASRFSAWGRAWELYNEGGYQQTRTMAAAASGGLFGLGAGKGWFKSVFAADNDLVFGLVSEELGLAVGFAAVLCICVMALLAVKGISCGRGGFYSIAACGAAALMLAQMMLNVFGSLDILPLTGVTFPFVSKGGTSLIASWGLAAFIGAALSPPRKAKAKGGVDFEKA